MAVRRRLLSAAVGGVLGAAFIGALLTIDANSAVAAPDPSPTPPAVNLVPGVLPSVPLPSARPIVKSVLSGVASTVHGVLAPPAHSSARHARDSVVAPSPASAATQSNNAPGSTGARSTAPAGTATPAASKRPAAAGAQKRTTNPGAAGYHAAPRRSGVALAAVSGAGAARSGVAVAAPPPILHAPAVLVRRAAEAVMHPGRILLVLVGITATGAVGMLGLVASLGRRPRSAA